MKRILALSAAAAMVFAACGSDDPVSTPAGTDSATTDPTATDPAVDDPTATDAMADGPEELNVAYFAQWPTPNQLGQEDGTFSDAVGAKVNWLPFPDGGSMTEAMLAGDVDISYSQGLTPFANTTNNGADLKVVGIAVAYAEADNCVYQGSLGITRENAAEVLDGAKVMSPTGNITAFKMFSTMEFLGVDLSSLEILPATDGATTAQAFADGQVDVGCAFGGPIVDMLDAGGTLVMTGQEQQDEIGISVYDVISIPTAFGEAHPELVTSFLKATDEFNQKWAADPEAANSVIALAAGMEDVGNFLGGENWFSFPTIEEQLSADWLGGQVAENMKAQLAKFVELGEIERSLDDFSGFVDTSYLEAAQG